MSIGPEQHEQQAERAEQRRQPVAAEARRARQGATIAPTATANSRVAITGVACQAVQVWLITAPAMSVSRAVPRQEERDQEQHAAAGWDQLAGARTGPLEGAGVERSTRWRRL